jgi:two-component system sensor histidine kinase KdpD
VVVTIVQQSTESSSGEPETGHVVFRPTVAVLKMLDEAPSKFSRYGQALLIVFAGTVVAEVLYRAFDTTRLSMVFLGSVLIAAVRLGVRPGLLAAVVSFFIYDIYLVEPRFTFTATPEDVLVLIEFLAVALLTGGLAGRVRDEREVARARAQELSILFDAGRTISAMESETALRSKLADLIAGAAGTEVRLRFDEAPAQTIFAGAASDADDLDHEDAEAVEALLLKRREPFETVRLGRWRGRLLCVDDRALGWVVWRASSPAGADSAERDKVVGVLVDLGAAAVARARIGGERAEMKAIRRADSLRTALLSSISHDFRTPIAAILASATSLLEYGRKFEPEVRDDLLRNIQEEAERLNRFVANLLNMTRIESGALEIQPSTFPVAEAVGEVLRRLEKRYGTERVRTEAVSPDLEVRADFLLFEQSFENIVDNALKLSPERSTVTVLTRRVDGRIAIEVVDEGQGVPAADLPHIFDKFYRASNARESARGTGLGLPIARGLIEAMDGEIEARARPDGASGLSFVISLPAAA